MNRGISDMAGRKEDPLKRQRIIPATEEQIIESNTYNSQRKASRNYDSKFEKIIVRLPQGSRDKINNYLSSSNKYPSTNAMIKALIEKEIKQKLDE